MLGAAIEPAEYPAANATATRRIYGLRLLFKLRQVPGNPVVWQALESNV